MADELRSEVDKEMIRLWRVWKTARQMCYDRGYEILDEELEVPLEEFRNRFAETDGRPDRKKMSFSLRPTQEMIHKHHDPKKPNKINAGTVWVEFNGEANIGVKQAKVFVHHLRNHNFSSGIFIAAVGITAAAVKSFAAVSEYQIDVFQEEHLMVNIMMHELVPKHVLLSPEEKQKLLERYRLKESQLPRIQSNDPVAKYMGLRRGQVVKIIRKSETAGRYASYRWCI